ncbi:hypothetical protein QE152_g37961 [Popillia japonica]|uniref:Reverse transcriptase n=1 Tax=Popillia japonica TaxID=7064 RepID=A0AAW1I8F5_POPJA
MNFLTTLFNVYARLIEAKVTKARAPWLTRNLRVFMELRDRALSEFRISFTQSTNNNSNDLIDYYNSNDLNSDAVFQFKLATVEEVHAILHGIKTKAYGCDGISSVMLKYCSPYIDENN